MVIEHTEEERERAASVHERVAMWAASQRNDASELRKMLPPAVASGTEMAVSNFAVSEDDRDAVYDRLAAAQVEIIDAAMEDLARGPHWAWWAIVRRHRLGGADVWRYELMAPGGVVPPGMYTNALLELEPILVGRGMLL